MPPIRIVMFGTGDFALPTFVHLCEQPQGVSALVTQPDRPQGRKQERLPSRIHLAASERGVPVDQPENVNAADSLARLREWAPDLIVTAAYGQILAAELLAIPRWGGINLHGSVLPAYRGAAPVARAIQHGERETGVTVIRMTPRIDAGGIIAVAQTPIEPNETAGDLEARLATLGAPLVGQAIESLVSGTALFLPQDKTKVTRAPKLTKDDGRIDWTMPSQAIHNLARALQPWPTAFTFWQPSEVGKGPVRLIIHRTTLDFRHGEPGRVLSGSHEGRLVVAAGTGSVEIHSLQVPGKQAMSAELFLRGHHVFSGDRMGPGPAT